MKELKQYIKTKFGYLFGIALILILFFQLMRMFFLAYYHELGDGAPFSEYIRSLFYGFRLDMVISGYVLVIPFLIVLLLYTPVRRIVLKKILRGYYLVVSVFLSIITVVDLGLYGYWRFRLDATPLFYLRQPKEALDSAPMWQLVAGFFLILIFAFVLWVALVFWTRLFFPKSKVFRIKSIKNLLGPTGSLMLGGLIFLMIRGSISVATANIAMAYHSNNQFFNQSSVNPVFSFIFSVTHQGNIMKGYEFYNENELASIYGPLRAEASADRSESCITDTILREKRPNIILVMMESFSANAVSCLNGPKGVTPQIDRLAEEGILFDNTIANSFRTDRGNVAILSAFPAQPTTSIMKYPDKAATLPSLAESLKKVGYDTYYLYGGDANFTNTRAYLSSTGYDHIIDLASFNQKYRMTKWGVPDAITFDYLAKDVKRLELQKKPFFYTFMTLSSHEPFDVPVKKFDNPYLNSIYYTDECVGRFIDNLKKSPEWNNTLVIFMADHGFLYPESATPEKLSRYHILNLWLGGALSKSERNGVLFNQVDLAATLLSQMGIGHEDFDYSKNVLSSNVSPFAFYSSPNLFGYVDSTGVTTFDCDSKKIIYNEGAGAETRVCKGKAYLQSVLLDMNDREKRFRKK